MALTINTRKDPDMAKVTVDRKLWLTADKDKLVEDGNPDAAFLWAVKGREVPAGEAERVGYKPARKSGQNATHKPEEGSESDVPGGSDDYRQALPAGHVACPEDGCEYTGTERGLKIHARSHEG